jgi:pyoverdine/dityrosine biosynthesis protein Dit1
MQIDSADGALDRVEPTGARADSERTARTILRLVMRFRRLANAGEPCASTPCEHCMAPHMRTVMRAVESNEPVHFVLPAFPAKSPNREKVLGVLPDMAERIALEFLQSLCEYVSYFYPPGARLTVCSDGRVFSDLVSVRDEDVTAYKEELRTLVRETGGTSIDVYDLESAFDGSSFDEMRSALCRAYAAPLERIREQVRSEDGARTLFNGIHRFLFEDQVVLRTGESRTQVREACRDLAYRVIQRSNAWSSLVADRLPKAVRLSIHPQFCHAAKIGIRLVAARENWITPWHGVILDTGRELLLTRRSEAERQKASLVYRRGRPSHFVAPSDAGAP